MLSPFRFACCLILLAAIVVIVGAQTAPKNDAATGDHATIAEAESLIAAAKAGKAYALWPHLRESADNSTRSYLIHRLGELPSTILVPRLLRERETSARRALILGMGGFGPEQFSHDDRRKLTATLLRWYENDVDSGIHAAIDWLLRRDCQGMAARRMNWQQSGALAALDEKLSGRGPGQRHWFVNKTGHTMVIVRQPRVFQIGAPADEPGRSPGLDSPDEPVQRVHIPRNFAISSKETTVAQFQRFLDANPEVRRRFAYPNDSTRMARVIARFSPEPDTPQIALTWYEAAMYCNWLSKEEGLPESEWVYPSNVDQIRSGMALPGDYLHRRGYRLPTEAEWEYAARAGSTTSRFFGSTDKLLDQYAWYTKNPPKTKDDPEPAEAQRTWPVGQLKPNDLGLFDVYGNVWELCQDRLQERTPQPSVREDVEDDVLAVSAGVSRTRRGGGFPYEAAYMRSANRDTRNAFPNLRRDNVGFRVAKTVE
jgi:formylglycine-generating enzyme required for sulfatase activity